MNDPRMLSRDLRMTVFDLPSHGRSFPPEDSVPGEHYNSEDRYIEIIAALVKKLGLKKTIVGAEYGTRLTSGLWCLNGGTHLLGCSTSQ
jgi:pimeloyl-ACP methyl ester carboxylesterase